MQEKYIPLTHTGREKQQDNRYQEKALYQHISMRSKLEAYFLKLLCDDNGNLHGLECYFNTTSQLVSTITIVPTKSYEAFQFTMFCCAAKLKHQRQKV